MSKPTRRKDELLNYFSVNNPGRNGVFELWKDLFPVLYGASVQDLAAREEAELTELLAPSM